jgi:hypothetical protein
MGMKKMTSTELADVAGSIFGSHWQTALAKHLKINPRTVRRWAAGDFPIPDQIAAELRVLATQGSIPDQDEWIIGQCPEGVREYLVHLTVPRFIARIMINEDEDSGGMADARHAHATAGGETIVITQWIDPPPQSGARISDLFAEAERVIDDYTEEPAPDEADPVATALADYTHQFEDQCRAGWPETLKFRDPETEAEAEAFQIMISELQAQFGAALKFTTH